ncbi:MAG: peptidase S8, partial [Actinobacteria bacterium]|nr:peptidase S8 [Actinomycetota bacterium]
DAANVIQRVVATAKDAGTPGTDAIYGFGLVDAAAAVNASVPKVTDNPMGSLAEWIKVYRRAASTPVPVPTATSTPTPAPVVAGPANPLGTVLPTVNLLRNAGVPLLVFVVFAALIAHVALRAVRRARAGRRTG